MLIVDVLSSMYNFIHYIYAAEFFEARFGSRCEIEVSVIFLAIFGDEMSYFALETFFWRIFRMGVVVFVLEVVLQILKQF